MISYTQDEAEVKVGPKELAGRIADHLEEAGQLSDELIANLRNSETPLTEPAGYQGTSEGSIASAMQSIILTKLKERDEIVGIGTSKAHDDRDISIITHSSTLEVPNRLLDQRSFAKLSKYGYWPSRWGVVEGGNMHEGVDSVAGKSWELRTVSLVWKDEYYQEDFESNERWFSDAEAVTDFAARVTDDDIDWAQYIPWYKTTLVPKYRRSHVARTTDWTEFPDPPDVRPRITDRFEKDRNPRVGDFIRVAMLRELERSLPSITNLSTGPAPWTTDEVSMVVTPTGHREAGIHSGTLCPSVALKKLAEYGYRPTDGWYDHPTVGYESDDPLTPRKFKFARGQVLNQWYSEQFESGIFDDEKLIPDYGFFSGLDWERIVESAQMQIISHRQLHELAHEHQGRF